MLLPEQCKLDHPAASFAGAPLPCSKCHRYPDACDKQPLLYRMTAAGPEWTCSGCEVPYDARVVDHAR